MRIFTLLITILFLFSCHQQQNKQDLVTRKTTADTLLEYLTSRIRKFSISDSVGMPDSNELFFYYRQRFDTSLLVHLKNEKGKVLGVVYQVALPYYLNGEDLDENDERIQFFEGYSFRTDSTHWKHITTEAECSLITDSLSEYFEPLDAPVYILAFNSKIRCNRTNAEQMLLSGFADYLRSNLLNECMGKKPKWYWEK